ncbi:MAG: acyltransferase family protein [Chlorobiaceae bacterium]|nr:acyltransferase family protein [Chlorobiaceae bacterium]
MDKRISKLRVLACFMVVLLHVSSGAFLAWNSNWWAGNFYDSLVRACVPLFLMITGATLLPRQEPISVFFRKRIVRVVPPMLFWSLFYLAWSSFNGENTGNWALAIIAGPTMTHLWFFYELIGLYLFIPVLRRFFNGSTRQEQLWFIGVWIVVSSILPMLRNLLSLQYSWAGYFDNFLDNFNVSFFAGLVGYLILGAYAAQGNVSTKAGWALFAAASCCTMTCTWLVSRWLGKPSELFFDYLSPFVIAAAYGLFIAFMDTKAGTPSRLVTAISDCTLGIYGLHVFVIDPLFGRNGLSIANGNPWLTVPLVSLGVFLATFGIVYLLRLVRPLRYVI